MEIYIYVYIEEELLVLFSIRYQHESAPDLILHFHLSLI